MARITSSFPGLVDEITGAPLGVIGADGQQFLFNQIPLSAVKGNISAGGGYLPSGPDGNGSGSANKTWGAVISGWGAFNAVQLIFANISATASVVNNTVVGVGTSIYPGGVNNIAAPSSGWRAPIGSVTVPAGSAKRPGMFITPKIQVRSVPRAAGELDGGLYPLLYVRNYTATGNTTDSYGSLPAGWAAKWRAANEGFTLQTAQSYGIDNVSDTSGWTSAAGEDAPAFCFFGAIFHYDQKFTTVCSVGDSIWAGNGDGATGISPFGFRATSHIRRSGKLVSWQAGGIGGSTMPDIAAHGKAIISQIAPDILILASYTINSAVSTQADWDDQWYNALDLAQAQMAAGRQVLMLTPLPNDSFSAAQNGYRINQRQRVISSGLPFVDVESLCGLNGRFLNPAHVTDGTHPTQAGHAAIGMLVRPVLNSLIP